jgi:hypothetical protein
MLSSSLLTMLFRQSTLKRHGAHSISEAIAVMLGASSSRFLQAAHLCRLPAMVFIFDKGIAI